MSNLLGLIILIWVIVSVISIGYLLTKILEVYDAQ
jgi:uncharacterized membrane protein